MISNLLLGIAFGFPFLRLTFLLRSRQFVVISREEMTGIGSRPERGSKRQRLAP